MEFESAVDCLVSIRYASAEDLSDLVRAFLETRSKLWQEHEHSLASPRSQSLKILMQHDQNTHECLGRKRNSTYLPDYERKVRPKAAPKPKQAPFSGSATLASFFYLGCVVEVRRDRRRGIVVGEKAGGWRDVKFPDGSCAGFRPSDLLKISSSTEGRMSPATESAVALDAYELKQQRKKTVQRHHYYPKHALQPQQARSHSPCSTDSDMLDDGSEGSACFAHSPGGWISNSFMYNSAVRTPYTHNNPNPSGLHLGTADAFASTGTLSLSHAHSHADAHVGAGLSSNTSSTSTAATTTTTGYVDSAPFSVGAVVSVIKAGKCGVILTEKAGGWRVVNFKDGTRGTYRPSELDFAAADSNFAAADSNFARALAHESCPESNLPSKVQEAKPNNQRPNQQPLQQLQYQEEKSSQQSSSEDTSMELALPTLLRTQEKQHKTTQPLPLRKLEVDEHEHKNSSETSQISHAVPYPGDKDKREKQRQHQ